MKTLSDLVVELFEEEECQYEHLEDETSFEIHSHGRNSSFSTLVFAENEECILRSYSKCPIKIPQQKLPAIAELIARINLNLYFGNCFSMDRYFPAIASVVYGNISPKKAIDLLPDSDDELTQEQVEESSEEDLPSDIKLNRHRGFFSDN